MSALLSPPISRFLAGWHDKRVWAQVLVRREGNGFELRHDQDRDTDPTHLRPVALEALRELAARTASDEFRPLKSAPTLRAGWRCRVAGPADLEAALSELYPASLSDDCALAEGRARPTTWTEYAERQLGRARALRGLEGEALARIVTAGCHASVCLKRRLWTGPGLAAEDAGNKSALPCLEPCAVFTYFARACLAASNAPSVAIQFAPDDLATLAAALRHALEHPPAAAREGPLDPRRLLRVLTVHQETWSRATTRTVTPSSDE